MVHDEPIRNKIRILGFEIMEKNMQDLQSPTHPVYDQLMIYILARELLSVFL